MVYMLPLRSVLYAGYPPCDIIHSITGPMSQDLISESRIGREETKQPASRKGTVAKRTLCIHRRAFQARRS